MNRHQSAREVHEQHESNRTAEAARVRQEVRLEDARRLIFALAEALEDLHRYSLIPDHGYASSPCEAQVRAALEAAGRSVP